MLFPNAGVVRTALTGDIFSKKEVTVSVLRLDLVHPIVSGNKLFKLELFLKKALSGDARQIVTFGGAYSNHLVATAYACRSLGLRSIGIVRGEAPPVFSHSLQACIEYGMELEFVSRAAYAELGKSDLHETRNRHFPGAVLVPEGGYDPDGAIGAARIMDFVPPATTHVCCAVGTATTLAGLSMHMTDTQHLLGIPVLREMWDIPQRMEYLTGRPFDSTKVSIIPDYHFGGYARKDQRLFAFMNCMYKEHGVPTDFVYTAKMMYGVIDLVEKDVFPRNSKIMCIHTGGLQGNESLPPGTVVF